MEPDDAEDRRADIEVRRVDLGSGPFADLPRHFADGDLVMSHVMAVLSSMFPDGEDYFVRSVRNVRDDITDPDLRRRVAGFIGQEAVHGREHRAFNERLAELGHPTRSIERFVNRMIRFRERISSRKVNLAVTAALEHYTALMAQVLMTDADARRQLGPDEVRHLFLWHALEESEHKAVAFDVYEHLGGGRRFRSVVMNMTTVLFTVAVLGGTTWSLLHDRATLRVDRLARSLYALRGSPWLRRDVLRHLRDYNRDGFHPDDHDTTALVAEWREALFGERGAVRDRLAA